MKLEVQPIQSVRLVKVDSFFAVTGCVAMLSLPLPHESK
jgi:hypothetical protein